MVPSFDWGVKVCCQWPDGVVRGKLGPAGIGGVLQNSRGDELVVSSKFLDVKDSNEVEVLVILGALQIFSVSFKWQLVVESDSLNAIIWGVQPCIEALEVSSFFYRDQVFVFPIASRVSSCCFVS